MLWSTLWPAAKDVILTGAGLVIIWTQITSLHPSDLLVGAGVTLALYQAVTHGAHLISGEPPLSGTGPPSPPSSSAPAPPPSASSSAGTRDG